MRRILLLLCLIPILFASSAGATIYYVANAGNDSCNGQSQTIGSSGTCAWKTIAHVNLSSFSAGDSILFNKGDIWRETLVVPSSGSAGNPITFDAYGIGNAPSIRNSYVKSSNGDWTNESGNFWYASGFTTDVGSIMINGTTVLTGKKSAKGSLTSQGDFYYDTDTGRAYLYSVGNPATVYSGGIECWWKGSSASNGHAIYITKEYIILQNIDVRYAGGHGIQVNGDPGNTPSNIIIQNNVISYIGGSYLTGTTRYGNGIEIWNSASNITVQNNTITQAFDEGADTQGIASQNQTQTNITFQNNSISYCGRGFSYGSTGTLTNINVLNNTITYSGFGYSGTTLTNTQGQGAVLNSLGTMTNCNFTHNVIKHTAPGADPIGQGIVVSGGSWNVSQNWVEDVYNSAIRISGDPSLTIAYNVIYNSNDHQSLFATSTGSNTNNLNIYNNTFFNYNNGNEYMIMLGAPGYEVSKVVMKNNIIMMAGNSTYNLVYVAPSDNSMTLDYNLYYRTTAGSLIDYGGVDYTQDQWATYKSASSQDAHSITPQNPLFVSAGTNFHLLPGSPARGKGVNVGLISDFDGLLLPAIPAIGAYESDSYPSTKRPFAPILY